MFGQAAVLEGPASALGLGMQKGLNAAFDEINAKGGVHGRKLKLISVNDGYEPDRAIAATKKLIEEDKVFALIGAGRHADLGRRAADRDRRQGAVHGRVHRRGLPAQSQARKRHQCARELRRRDRSLGEAPHRGPEDFQDRDLLPGRRVRPRRPLRLQEGDGQAQHGDRRRGDVRAQHGRGEDRRARDEAAPRPKRS